VETAPSPTVVKTNPYSQTQTTVVVKQNIPAKPYAGTTSRKSFQQHFLRVCQINGWLSQQERVQYLTLSLEGPAADVLRDIDEHADSAWSQIWEALRRRFGTMDDERDAMHRFETCKQGDDMSIPEFEQKLRILHHDAWPQTTVDQRNANLKSRFQDGLLSLEMRQFLRLHARNDTFEDTVAKARQFLSAAEATKPKTVIRIVTDADNNAAQPSLTTEQALLKGFESLGNKLDNILTLRSATETDQLERQSQSSSSGSRPYRPLGRGNGNNRPRPD